MSPRDAQRVLGRLIADGTITAEEGSGWLAALGDQTATSDTQLKAVRDALNAARPRVGALVQDGKLTAEEGRGLATWFNRRGKQVALALAGKSATGGRDLDEEAATGEDPGRRAQSSVRRLITEGRVSASEGRVMFQAMTDPSTIAQDATQLEGVRVALEQARPRIGELVRQGHLTVEEGRDLSKVFDARATAAATALKGIKDAASRRATESEANRRKPGNQAQRPAGRKGAEPATRPKRAGDAEPAGNPGQGPKRGQGAKPSGGEQRQGGAQGPEGPPQGKRPGAGARRGEGPQSRPAGKGQGRPAGKGESRPGAGGRPKQSPPGNGRGKGGGRDGRDSR